MVAIRFTGLLHRLRITSKVRTTHREASPVSARFYLAFRELCLACRLCSLALHCGP